MIDRERRHLKGSVWSLWWQKERLALVKLFLWERRLATRIHSVGKLFSIYGRHLRVLNTEAGDQRATTILFLDQGQKLLESRFRYGVVVVRQS